ncbi:nucleotidyltransferase family protein [Bacillaceae bacterium W0354]
MLKNEEDILALIENDKKMMEIIRAASQLNLPDWWICAGFVRSKIWDALHSFNKRTEIPDVDVIYFDQDKIDEDIEKRYEDQLKAILPYVPWSVKNQARMHVVNGIPPYTSCMDAISKFPETATALGVKLDNDGHLVLAAPWGIDDVINLEVRPTPFFKETEERLQIYEERLAKKNWQETWYKIDVFYI